MDVRKQYGELAPSYDERWRGYVAGTLGILTSRLELRGDERVLDVACGTGELEKLLLAAHPGLSVTGVDITPAMLDVARGKMGDAANVRFVEAGAEKLPFGDADFDVVVSASSFHFFDDPVASLREMKRVLAPGGRVVILDWCRDFLVCRVCDIALKIYDPAYKRCYGSREIFAMYREAGLEVVRLEKVRRGIWGLMVVEGIR